MPTSSGRAVWGACCRMCTIGACLGLSNSCCWGGRNQPTCLSLWGAVGVERWSEGALLMNARVFVQLRVVSRHLDGGRHSSPLGVGDEQAAIICRHAMVASTPEGKTTGASS